MGNYSGLQETTVVYSGLQQPMGHYSSLRWPAVTHSSFQWPEGACSIRSSGIKLKISLTVSVIKKIAGKMMQIRLFGAVAVSPPAWQATHTALIPRTYAKKMKR
jgi:hypothetical protein